MDMYTTAGKALLITGLNEKLYAFTGALGTAAVAGVVGSALAAQDAIKEAIRSNFLVLIKLNAP